MKKIVLFLLLMISFIHLSADIKVEYVDKNHTEKIAIKDIEGKNYLNVYELNKAFKAYIDEDVTEQRINVNLYNKQFLFLMNSSYVSFNNQPYNIKHEIICIDGRYFIPVEFVTHILPSLLDEIVSYDSGKQLIKAHSPVDSSIRRVYLDPGHGGKDPGAIGYSGTYEKNIVMNITREVKKLLEQEGLEVILSRDTDEFVSLKDRTEKGNQAKSQIFVSIHCNASKSKTAQGAEVYFLSTATTSEARIVEALENSVVEKYEGGAQALKKYDDLDYILMDLAQSEHLEESSDLAMKIQANIVATTKAYNRGVKQAGFYVLRGAYMPSVLVEVGFISNREEEKKLIKTDYQKKIAQAIFNGIVSFKNKFDQM
ncbi:MAG: N-acetylmuramoyl-L-alanine amidase [Candidatus Cloacimonetes bacterium]|nr:N-acetylmuramoyl-L-alanine amidase [Candidatus Cloacimonadota bacterium]